MTVIDYGSDSHTIRKQSRLCILDGKRCLFDSITSTYCSYVSNANNLHHIYFCFRVGGNSRRWKVFFTERKWKSRIICFNIILSKNIWHTKKVKNTQSYFKASEFTNLSSKSKTKPSAEKAELT